MKLYHATRDLSLALLFNTLTCAQLNTTTVSNVSTTACPSQGGVHIIAARGSTVKPEPGYGAIGILKDAVLHSVPGSTAEFVHYPATLRDYINSEVDGALAMKNSINDYISRCGASSPLVLMGHSQGAQVTADSLVGQDEGFPSNASVSQGLPPRTLSGIAAVVLMGDPSFNTTETFYVGNATKNGIFPRRNVAGFNVDGLASRIVNYCDFNDPFCASGNRTTGLQVHLEYIQEYGPAALEFVEDQIKSFHANGTSTPEALIGDGLRQERSLLGVILVASSVGLLLV